MIYKSLTGQKVAGTGTVDMNGYIFGGALITADGTNAAVVLIRENDSSGDILFDLETISPGAILLPSLSKSKRLYYSISGTGASAQLFEWVE